MEPADIAFTVFVGVVAGVLIFILLDAWVRGK